MVYSTTSEYTVMTFPIWRRGNILLFVDYVDCADFEARNARGRDWHFRGPLSPFSTNTTTNVVMST